MDSRYHFLDSNIFLGIALDSNNSSCKYYFYNHYEKITSDTVEFESELVILKFMIISINILRYISNHVQEGNVSDSEIPNYIKLLENKFLAEYEDEKFPFGFKKEKFIRLAHNLFKKYYYWTRRGIFYNPFDLIMESQKMEVLSSYKQSINSLDALFKHLKIYSFNETMFDQSIIGKLNSYDIHNPDARILLEAFKVSKLVNDFIFFITTDNGIVDKSEVIFNEFDNKVLPKKPDDFLIN